MFCEKCGNENENDACFCVSCGNKLEVNDDSNISTQIATPNNEIIIESRDNYAEECKTGTNISKISNALYEQMEAYCQPKNFLFNARMSSKQKSNFCKNCNISNSSKIIGFIDTTVFLSGKDGIAFLEDRIIWRNFAYADVETLTYAEILAGFSSVREKKIYFSGKVINPTRELEIEAKDIYVIISKIADVWYNDCRVLSEFEKVEKEIFKDITISNEHYYRRMRDGMMSNHKIESAGRHIGNFLDVMLAVSQDQTNAAHKRNVCKENATKKADLELFNSYLTIALSFGEKLKQADSSLSQEFIDFIDNDYTTTQILVFLIGHTRTLLTEANIDNEINANFIGMLMLNTVVPYAEYYHRKTTTKQQSKLEKALVDPMEELQTSDVMQHVKLIGTEYSVYFNDSRESLCDCFIRNIITVCITKRYNTLENTECNVEEKFLIKNLSELYLGVLIDPVSSYLDSINSKLDDALGNYFT